jgi:hypothetical protein
VFFIEHFFMSELYVDCQKSFRHMFPETRNLNKSAVCCLVDCFHEKRQHGQEEAI